MTLEHSFCSLAYLQMVFQLGLCVYGLLNWFQIKTPKFTSVPNIPASPNNFCMNRKYVTYLAINLHMIQVITAFTLLEKSY